MALSRQELRFATEDAARDAAKTLGEPPWLTEARLVALARWRDLPLASSPLFVRHTESLRGAEAFSAATAKPRLDGKAAGARFEELGRALRDPEPLRAALTRELPGFAEDKASNLPRALASTGALLHVAKDKHIEEPFTIHYAPGPGAAFARNVLLLEAGARATVVEELAGQAAGLFGCTTEVHLGEGAELRLLGVDTSGAQQLTLASRHATLAAHARLELHHAFTGGALTKGRTDVALAGQGSSVRQSEVVFGSKAQRFDLTTHITHQGPDTLSDALSKAVLKEQARANIKGLITITQEGKGSDSYLQQHAMILSKQARCIAIPSLEIVNREIKRAKHAATVAQVDEAQIFYLETRGLPEAEARKAIVLGFLGPLLERLGEERAERVRSGIEATWEA